MIITTLNKSEVLESVAFELNIVDYQIVHGIFGGDFPRYCSIDDETGTYYFDFGAHLYTPQLEAALERVECEVRKTFRPIYDKVVMELTAKEFEEHRSGYTSEGTVKAFPTHYEVTAKGEYHTHGVLIFALSIANNAKFEAIRADILNKFSNIHA